MMGGTTVMMKKSTLILCSLCLGFSMTACEQKKEVKKAHSDFFYCDGKSKEKIYQYKSFLQYK